MSFEWQSAVALLLVAGAMGYLARRGYLSLGRAIKGGCGSGCHGCGKGDLVELEAAPRASPRARDGRPPS